MNHTNDNPVFFAKYHFGTYTFKISTTCYKVIITATYPPNKYRAEVVASNTPFETVKKLRTTLAEGFSGIPERELDILTNKSLDILTNKSLDKMIIHIVDHSLCINTDITLDLVKKSTIEPPTDKVQEKMNEKDQEIRVLREQVIKLNEQTIRLSEQMEKLYPYLPWLNIWYKFIPAQTFGIHPLLKLMPMKFSPKCDHICLDKNSLKIDNKIIIDLEDNLEYPIIELITLYNMNKLTIIGKSTRSNQIMKWLEKDISLQITELYLEEQSIRTIAAISKLPLKKLTLKNCRMIICDVYLVAHMLTLEVLKVTPDINITDIRGVNFGIKLIKK